MLPARVRYALCCTGTPGGGDGAARVARVRGWLSGIQDAWLG